MAHWTKVVGTVRTQFVASHALTKGRQSKFQTLDPKQASDSRYRVSLCSGELDTVSRHPSRGQAFGPPVRPLLGATRV